MTPQPLLELGYVARAHGLRGEVAIRTFDPASEALDVVERVFVRTRSGEERELFLEEVRPTPKENIIAFEGVESRTEAEALVGSKVFVFREDLEPPAEGEFFQGDLVGLTAVDESGAELGRVEEIWATGEVPNLVIRAPKRPELVVPFADDFVPTVDIAAGRIVIRPPEYEEVGRPGQARGAAAAPEATGGEDAGPEDGEGSGDAE
ncbi:16S rRNA processing protein RimM [Pyxidicoccus fallax]|uniref:Ribosome maturation factor RimM n=1 Tax=Pyxidicoccus fallax TaxID=394095 RepID=A0A848LNA6_9BACT|nr:16S rRNA processing protein RimM [Pyxidicoccus fallax]NPC85568.1 16S rRNA processing protein RimM [Pyxidicoccus fallax]